MSTERFCGHCGGRVRLGALLCPSCYGPVPAGPDAEGGAVARPVARSGRRHRLHLALAIAGVAGSVALSTWLLARTLGGDSRDRHIEHALAATVTLYSNADSARYVGQGSGFLIEPGDLAVSALHVVAAGRHHSVVTEDGRSYTVLEVHAYDIDRDLVVLRFGRRYDDRIESPGPRPVMPLGHRSRPTVGDAVFTVSSPVGLRSSFSEGVISSLRETERGMLLQITAPLSSGSSGGAVMDRRGRVIGVAISQYAEGQNITFAMPIDTLHRLLERPTRVSTAGFHDRMVEHQLGTLEAEWHALPSDTAALRDLGVGALLLEGGSPGVARPHLERASHLAPDNAAALYLHASCLFALGEMSEGEAALRDYLRVAADSSRRTRDARAWLGAREAERRLR